jgi:hypothetical protein
LLINAGAFPDPIQLLILARRLINLGPNLPINITTKIPITGIIITSGAHSPSVDIDEKTSSSFITVALWSRLMEGSEISCAL